MADKFNSVEEQTARTKAYHEKLMTSCLTDIRRAAADGDYEVELLKLHTMLFNIGEETEAHLAGELTALGYKVQRSGWFKRFKASW